MRILRAFIKALLVVLVVVVFLTIGMASYILISHKIDPTTALMITSLIQGFLFLCTVFYMFDD